MLRKFVRFLSLTHGERKLFVRGFVDLACVDFVLRVRGFQSAVEGRAAASGAHQQHVQPSDLARASRYAYWLERASRHHLIRARCLHRAIALHRRLRGEGLPSELRIGVRKANGVFEAHAWVVLGGSPVNESAIGLASFVPLTTPSGAQPNWTHAAGDPIWVG